MIKVDRLGEICCNSGRELSGFHRSSALGFNLVD
jgi:hypothetical protein